jgi:hypothetical protein
MSLFWVCRQRNRPTPSRVNNQLWQLRCRRERVWNSAAPRPYGPSRDWGGAWGGGYLKYSNRFEAQGPTQVCVCVYVCMCVCVRELLGHTPNQTCFTG